MRVRILTSCTGTKTVESPAALSEDDFARGGAALERKRARLEPLAVPAVDLYAGRQHVHLRRGLAAADQAGHLDVDLHILSAGFGLVHAGTPLVPYEATYSGKTKTQIRAMAQRAGVPEDVAQWLAQPADLNVVLLADPYLTACGLTPDTAFGAPTLLFCGTVAARTLPDWPNVRKVALARADAKRLREGLVWLKGWLAERLLSLLAADPDALGRLLAPQADVLGLLTPPTSDQQRLAL